MWSRSDSGSHVSRDNNGTTEALQNWAPQNRKLRRDRPAGVFFRLRLAIRGAQEWTESKPSAEAADEFPRRSMVDRARETEVHRARE